MTPTNPTGAPPASLPPPPPSAPGALPLPPPPPYPGYDPYHPYHQHHHHAAAAAAAYAQGAAYGLPPPPGVDQGPPVRPEDLPPGERSVAVALLCFRRLEECLCSYPLCPGAFWFCRRHFKKAWGLSGFEEAWAGVVLYFSEGLSVTCLCSCPVFKKLWRVCLQC
eukprot:1160581-Pelagomonas_calceolata.AAC.5